METSEGRSPSKSQPGSFPVRLGAGGVILVLFVITMSVVSLRRSWNNHQERAAATTQNLALVLDRYVSDTFSKADLAIWAVKDELERTDRIPNNQGAMNAFIQRQLERSPGVVAIRTTNALGVIEHGTGQDTGSGISVADREYFARLRDAPGAVSVISKPVMGRVVGQWIVVLARRLERPGRGFAGVVYAVVPLDQFARAFSDLDVGPHGSVSLRDLESGLVVRHPKPSTAGTDVGQKLVSAGYLAFARSGQPMATYRALTPFDRVQRMFSVRRVAGQPFILVVGLAEQDYLTGWRTEMYQQLTGLLLFICLTLAASLLIQRTWSRQQATQRDLERLLAEVKTLGGLLPICSVCKKIRDDKGYWNQIESYLRDRTDAEFTHGICPECAAEYFPKSSRPRART